MRFASLLLLLLLCPLLLGAAPAADGPPKSFDVKAIDDYLARQTKAKGIVGLSVAILKDGKVVLAKGYGKASLKSGEPVLPVTPFAAGSVTKQFTCACVLLLAEQGKLSIKDPVSKYYPALTRAKDVTLLDLMGHTSGYPDYYPLDFVDRRMEKPIAPDDLIRAYATKELDFEPGTRWSYSNTGYIVLGRVVEKASGKPFGEFLEENILRPLGMKDSYYEPDPARKGLAAGYTSFALGGPEPATPEAVGWTGAAGGLYTTPADLLKWDLALASGKVLERASYDLMCTARKLKDGRSTDYGCGLMIREREGETVLTHGGAVSGFLTSNTLLPRTRSAVALMTNSEYADSSSLHGELLSLLLKSNPVPKRIPKVAGPAPKEMALELLRQMQSGELKRENLGEEFEHYLSKERVAKAKDRLKALGEPEKVEVLGVHERGGMEVAVIRFTFKGAKVRASLYRTPDGKVQQFLLFGG